MLADPSLSLAACPDEDDLVLFVEARLSPDEATRLEAHLDVCAACHRVVAALALAHSRPIEKESLVMGRSETLDSGVPRRRQRLVAGSVLGRYILGEPLGEGGMGVVYAARDTDLHRPVALKVVSGGGDDSSTRRRRLLREARLAAQLRHPNVVVVHDVGESGDSAYLAMELVRGRSLRAYVNDSSISLRTRLGWLLDVARALAAAHTQGLVHRDVKPENVMVDESGAVKVVDFGIARNSPHAPAGVGKDPSLLSVITQEGSLVGTPSYMAPEQLRDGPIDARIDQFAWGVLAYELVSRARPWKETSLALVSEILTSDPPPLPESVPRQVRAIIRRTMSKSPEDRFVSMDDVVNALAPHADLETRPRRSAWRLWPLFAAASLGAASLLAAHAIAPSRASSREPFQMAEVTPSPAAPEAAAREAPTAPPAVVPMEATEGTRSQAPHPSTRVTPRPIPVPSGRADGISPGAPEDPLDFRK